MIFQRQRFDDDDDSDDYEEHDDAPQIVVLKKGDLTAEEAEAEKQRLEKGKKLKHE